MAIVSVGIDLAKSVLTVHGVDECEFCPSSSSHSTAI